MAIKLAKPMELRGLGAPKIKMPKLKEAGMARDKFTRAIKMRKKFF